MATDDIGGIIAEEFGGEVVSMDRSQKPNVVDLSAPKVVDLTESPETEEVSNEAEPQQETEQKQEQETESEEHEQQEDSSEYTENQEEDEYDDSSGEVDESDDYDEVGNFLNAVNEQFGTEFEDIEEFGEAISQQGSPNYASEQVARMDEFVRNTGRSVYDYIRTQSVDYTKVPDEVLMKEYLRQDNPELTAKELDVFFKSTYKLDSKKYNADEIALGKIQLKKDASTARKDFLQMQEDYRMPSEDMQADENHAELRDEWVGNMNLEVDDLESLTFQINDKGETFDFALNDEHKDRLKQVNSNLDGYFDRYVDDNGDWNYDRLNLDMFIRDNFEDIIRSVANQYRSKGTEQVIEDIKNPSFNAEPKPLTGKSVSILDQLSDQIFG